ncbi:MAG: hypothetical protein A3H42_01940 [Deltaproteobacteria bacterium RIFCSPLOWO2_02_FULL_46_8]|nr:MAG: hypothetical protein A3H42_01940 [Deltaproteobacteria bacterium RIFCSPLOWO2_02_FULL_46_8]
MLDKFIGTLLGGAIGDAIGMEAEGLTAEEVASYGGITGYHAHLHPRWRPLLPAGRWTDDTALTLAIARSIVRCQGVDLTDIATEHVRALETEGPRGWGEGTLWGIKNFRMGLPPNHCGCKGYAGNGTAMKAAPLGLWHCREGLKEIAQSAKQIAQFTHNDNRAVIAMALQAEAVRFVLDLTPQEFDPWQFLERITECAKAFERRFPPEESFLPKIEKVRELINCPIAWLVSRIGNGCYVLESWPFAVACFLRNPMDLKAAALEAANAGGDADSTASMACAMVGALVGAQAIPKDLVAPLERSGEIQELALELWKTRFSP